MGLREDIQGGCEGVSSREACKVLRKTTKVVPASNPEERSFFDSPEKVRGSCLWPYSWCYKDGYTQGHRGDPNGKEEMILKVLPALGYIAHRVGDRCEIMLCSTVKMHQPINLDSEAVLHTT